MLKEAIFIISYVAYILLEKNYGLGALIVIANGVLGLFLKSYIAKALSIAFLSMYIGFRVTGGYTIYQLLSFFGLSILYPVFGGQEKVQNKQSTNNKSVQSKATPTSSNIKATQVTNNYRSPSNYDSPSDTASPISNGWDANERLYDASDNTSSPLMTKEGEKKVQAAADSARKREHERRQKRISEILSPQK